MNDIQDLQRPETKETEPNIKKPCSPHSDKLATTIHRLLRTPYPHLTVDLISPPRLLPLPLPHHIALTRDAE